MFFPNNISEEYLMTWENIQDAFGENAQWEPYIVISFFKNIRFGKK